MLELPPLTPDPTAIDVTAHAAATTATIPATTTSLGSRRPISHGMTPRPNRVAVIGDVHACDRRLDLLLTHLDEQDLDLVACVGDLVDDSVGTIPPLGIGTGGVYAGAPRCRFETG